MNNDKHNLDLEALLAEVEHAGRDARRREELGAMIDGMAATRSHGFWWWTARVAAAACVLFFISTAVRVWFIPTGVGVEENMVAQGNAPETVAAAIDTVPALPAAPKPAPLPRRAAPKAAVAEYVAEAVPAEPATAEEETDVEPDTVINIEEVLAPDPMPVAQVEEQPADNVDVIAAPIVSVGAPAEAPAVERKPRRESIFKSLFRRDDISKMDGTMLAINIL